MYFQVGLVTLVGLSAKNAILICEVALEKVHGGMAVAQAAVEAAQARLRAIVMTSLAFILGVLPLVKADGAGAATQHSVGTGILGGMLAATLVGVFFTPLFYFLVTTWMGGKRPPPAAKAATGEAVAPHDGGHA